jgi:hypothetical protein
MNDLLNFGRMHFFLPDSRLHLDLTTDKTLKEARFDRHYVRDMTWSRHQLEEVAEQRFSAAQVRSSISCPVPFRLRILAVSLKIMIVFISVYGVYSVLQSPIESDKYPTRKPCMAPVCDCLQCCAYLL